MLMADNKRLQQRLKAMQETINSLTERNSHLLLEKATNGWAAADTDKSVSDMISGYLVEIENLKAKLIESEEMYHQLKKSMSSPRNLKLNPQLESKILILKKICVLYFFPIFPVFLIFSYISLVSIL